MIRKISLLAFLLFHLVLTAQTKTFYVSPLGNAANNGLTECTPLNSVKDAINRASAGDIINIRHGIYYEDTWLINKNNIKIIGSQNWTCHPVSLDDPGKTIINVIGSANRFVNMVNASYTGVTGVKIENIIFDFSNNFARMHPIFIEGGGFDTIKNCVIIDAKEDAISIIGSSNNLLHNNIIGAIELLSEDHKANPANSITIEGKKFNNFQEASNNKVLNNTIHSNNSHFGINMNITDVGVTPGDWFCSHNDIDGNRIDSCWSGIYIVHHDSFHIHNNIINKCIGWTPYDPTAPGYPDEMTIADSVEGHGINLHRKFKDPDYYWYANGKIYHNTIYRNRNVGLWNKSAYKIDVKNNIFFNNGIDEFKPNTRLMNGYHCIIMDVEHDEKISIFENNLYFNEDISKFPLAFRYLGDDSIGGKWEREQTGYYNQNPQLFNPEGENFTIKYTSYVINRAVSLPFPSYYNTSFQPEIYRPLGVGPDIGAYESNDLTQSPLEFLSVTPISSNTLELEFNQDLDQESALNKNNYFIHDVKIKELKLKTTKKVQIKTEEHVKNKNYLVVVDNIKDATGEMILPQFRSNYYAMNFLGKSSSKHSSTLKEFSLSQNYPNPFNPSTTINYSIPERGMVTIKVFDLLGREIRTLINEEKQTGSYEVSFNADGLPSGIYFYSIHAGKFSETRKMLLIK